MKLVISLKTLNKKRPKIMSPIIDPRKSSCILINSDKIMRRFYYLVFNSLKSILVMTTACVNDIYQSLTQYDYTTGYVDFVVFIFMATS